MNEPIAIIWAHNADKPDDMSFGFLAYDGGNGPVRTYYRNRYDSRVDLGRDRAKNGPLPYCRSWREAMAFFLTHPDRTECQVPVRVLRAIFRGTDFAEPVAGGRCTDDGIHNNGSIG